MTRVVVVNPEREVAEVYAAMLRACGYEVDVCPGPTVDPCPVLHALPCPLVDRADVLIYDAWAGGDDDGGRQLITDVREMYCDLPVILTSVDGGIDWVETEGPHRVFPLRGPASTDRFWMAVERALEDQGLAV